MSRRAFHGSNDHQAACVLGLLVGDAAGAPLEFTSRSTIPASKVDWALNMPGGGVHHTGPGQITDDGELALCLLQALRKIDPLSPFDPVAVTQECAHMYSAWYRSKPFDIGMTCEKAFRVLCGKDEVYDESALAAVMMREAEQGSQANGALMRVAPIPVWLAGLDDQDKVVDCARYDALLSHPNPVCQDCNAAYCLAVWHLIRNPGDAEGAIQRATAWTNAHGGVDVQKWLELSKEGGNAINANENKGHVKWGFTLAFHHLRQRSSFEGGLRDTLMKGGDTDTNAAIVGAMLGALHGAVPQHLAGPVMAYQAGEGRPRPEFVTPSYVLKQGVLNTVADDGKMVDGPTTDGWWSQVLTWFTPHPAGS